MDIHEWIRERKSDSGEVVYNATMKKPSDGDILVVGAAHPDIFADYERSQADYVDKVGELQYSIGGTAYNIAINLGQKYTDVALYTYIKKDSIFADLITRRLERNGVKTDFVQYSSHIPESGFVGIREDGDLVSAVTASGLTKVTFNERALETAIEGAALVVLDCNLSEKQIGLTLEIANKHNKKTIVSGVSESKSLRVKNARANITLFAINYEEACHFFDCTDITPEKLSAFQTEHDIENIVVTNGNDGYMVADASGTTNYTAPQVDHVVSSSGAGDALLAGICHTVYEKGDLQWDLADDKISEYISDVLRHEGSTLGATTTRNELNVRDRVNKQVRKMARYSRLEKAGIIVGLLSAVVTVSSYLFGYVSVDMVRVFVEDLISLYLALGFR